jgi:hypothetical protein
MTPVQHHSARSSDTNENTNEKPMRIIESIVVTNAAIDPKMSAGLAVLSTASDCISVANPTLGAVEKKKKRNTEPQTHAQERAPSSQSARGMPRVAAHDKNQPTNGGNVAEI